MIINCRVVKGVSRERLINELNKKGINHNIVAAYSRIHNQGNKTYIRKSYLVDILGTKNDEVNDYISRGGLFCTSDDILVKYLNSFDYSDMFNHTRIKMLQNISKSCIEFISTISICVQFESRNDIINKLLFKSLKSNLSELGWVVKDVPNKDTRYKFCQLHFSNNLNIDKLKELDIILSSHDNLSDVSYVDAY